MNKTKRKKHKFSYHTTSMVVLQKCMNKYTWRKAIITHVFKQNMQKYHAKQSTKHSFDNYACTFFMLNNVLSPFSAYLYRAFHCRSDCACACGSRTRRHERVRWVVSRLLIHNLLPKTKKPKRSKQKTIWDYSKNKKTIQRIEKPYAENRHINRYINW